MIQSFRDDDGKKVDIIDGNVATVLIVLVGLNLPLATY